MKYLKEYPTLLGIECRPKGDWKGWHNIVPAFFFLWGLFNKTAKYDFYNRYYTTLGRTLYIPESHFEDFIKEPNQSLLRHEAVHAMDDEANPVWFKVSYVLFPSWRVYWETRGYAQNMIFAMETTGSVPLYTRLMAVSQFAPGSIYRFGLSMSEARKLVDDLADKIENKEYQGNYPDIKKDWNK